MSKKDAARAVPFNFQRLISLTISIISRAIKCGVIRSQRDVRCASRITENFDVNLEEGREREKDRENRGRRGGGKGRKGYICNCKSINDTYHPMPPAPVKNISQNAPRNRSTAEHEQYTRVRPFFRRPGPGRYLVAYLFLHR